MPPSNQSKPSMVTGLPMMGREDEASSHKREVSCCSVCSQLWEIGMRLPATKGLLLGNRGRCNEPHQWWPWWTPRKTCDLRFDSGKRCANRHNRWREWYGRCNQSQNRFHDEGDTTNPNSLIFLRGLHLPVWLGRTGGKYKTRRDKSLH